MRIVAAKMEIDVAMNTQMGCPLSLSSLMFIPNIEVLKVIGTQKIASAVTSNYQVTVNVDSSHQ